MLLFSDKCVIAEYLNIRIITYYCMKHLYSLLFFASALSLQAQTGYEANTVIKQLSSSLKSGETIPGNLKYEESNTTQKSDYFVQKKANGDLEVLQLDYAKSNINTWVQTESYRLYTLEKDGDIIEETFDLSGNKTGGTKTDSHFDANGTIETKDVLSWTLTPTPGWVKTSYYKYVYDNTIAGSQILGGSEMAKLLKSRDLCDNSNNVISQEKYNYTKIGQTPEEIAAAAAAAAALAAAKTALTGTITDANTLAATITHQAVKEKLQTAITAANAVATNASATTDQLTAAKTALLAAIDTAKAEEAAAIAADSAPKPTAIDAVQNDLNKSVIYTLDGQIVTDLKPGKAYIINGKKIVIK